MTDGQEFLYEFGPYTLDGRERVLLRDGRPVSLAPKALETLLVLLRNSGHLVEKEQLMSEVWPATYVEEANLTQNISILRKVLSEGSDGGSFIETVPRRGYRFTIPVRRISVASTTTATEGDEVTPGERVYRFVAILPFANVGPDKNMEYLSDGITESIINSLSQLPQLRVMSRNTVFRYKGREIDAQRIGKDLVVDAVLVGRVQLQDERLLISTELVDVANGWQLWSDNYDRGSKAIFEVQDEIARQISTALRVKLTGDDEQRLTKRYTESADAYQAYLQGRFHWSKFTRDELEQATIFFRQAIDLDPNYALAYAGIVDCYLRLATNYIPPGEEQPGDAFEEDSQVDVSDADESLEPVKTRHQWDWTGVERELRRAAELKTNYPAAHQWHAAYMYSLNLYREAVGGEKSVRPKFAEPAHCDSGGKSILRQIRSATLTPGEEVQILCAIAREQTEAGNYEAGCQILRNWWTVGEWPTLSSLNSYAAGDLLFTVGSLTGWVASARQIPDGQKHAQALLNGCIGIFEQLGAGTRSCEAQIELGYCYYREGLFDLARVTIQAAIERLPKNNLDLQSVGLVRLAIVERHAGRLQASLARLREAKEIVERVGPWVSGRHHQELGTTLKELYAIENRREYCAEAQKCYRKALHEFQAIGNHRYSAVVENNHGYLLMRLGDLEKGEAHLKRARNRFHLLNDELCGAQVEETLARLYMAAHNYYVAEQCINRAVLTLEKAGHHAVLAEALTTKGTILGRLKRVREAKCVLYRASQLAEQCGDGEGATRPLVIILDELNADLAADERRDLKKLLRGFSERSNRK